MGSRRKRFPFGGVGCASETWLPKNEGVTLTGYGHPPKSWPAWIFQHGLFSRQPLLHCHPPPLSGSHGYKYCNLWALVCPSTGFRTLFSACSPPTTFFLTRHYLWFSHSFHHPFRYSKVLDYCLKCLLKIKTEFLSEVNVQLSSCPQWPTSGQSSVLHKSMLHALKWTTR